MSKTKFVDFKAVKAAITMEQVLEHYGLMPRFKRSGDSLSGPCPIHKGENPTQFRVSISKNIWHCFSECKHGGNVLDFVAKMEDASIHAAALKAIEWFHLDPDAMSSNSGEDEQEQQSNTSRTEGGQAPKPAPSKPASEPEKSVPNKSLKFRLEKLKLDHPYLAERGLTPETIAEFGLGFCEKGTMEGRIAIPIHNAGGEVVAYAGRWPGDPGEDTPKYKLPAGFRKSQELFNLHRAMKEPKEKPLVIVEGFFGCMKFYQHGCRKIVALMGSTMSYAQQDLICQMTAPEGQIMIVLDEDDAGKAGRDDIALRLSKFCFVKVIDFKSEGTQPEDLSEEEMVEFCGGDQ
jgi:DNA primase